MPQATDVYWQRAMLRARIFQPDIQAAILRAFAHARTLLSGDQLTEIIRSGDLDQLFTDILNQAALDDASLPVRSRLRSSIARGFTFVSNELPNGGKVNGQLAVMFDHLNPDVVTAIRQMESKVLASLHEDIRDVVRAHVSAGLQAGETAPTIARGLREVVGLGPTQLEQVANYRRALESGESVASYTLRNKRLATNTPAQIDAAVDAYRKRRIAQNAETVARTASLDAMKLGQRLSWQSAIDRGLVDPNRLRHRWIGVMDDRERAEHVAMERESQPFNQRYSNGEFVPGESTWNCRCIDQFYLASA